LNKTTITRIGIFTNNINIPFGFVDERIRLYKKFGFGAIFKPFLFDKLKVFSIHSL